MLHYIKGFKNDESGFTLLEAIVSIGVLALLSAFILQMFIVSAGANQRAQAIDSACAEAVTAIDLFQSGASANEFLASGFLTGDYDVTEKDETFGLVVLDGYHIVKHYNEKGGARFRLEIDVKPSTKQNINDITGFNGKLYEIRVVGYNENPKMNIYTSDAEENIERELVNFSAKKYFGE